MLSIRKAIKTDVKTILELIQGLAEFEKLSHEVVATEELLKKTLFEEGATAEVIIGEWNGEPVSFALFFHNYSTFLAKPGIYLEDLFVQPDFRSKGIGKELLKHLSRLALERGCGRLEWSVLNWNERAIQFYKSLGASAQDEWTVYRMTEKEMVNLASTSN